MNAIDPILMQAADWYASLMGDDPDFDGFTRWLEGNDAHRAAYDRVVMADDAVLRHTAALTTTLPANDLAQATPQRRLRAYWPVMGGAMAAALALTVALPMMPHSGPRVETTAPGEMRTIALADTTRIHLDSASSIALDGENARAIRLTQGRALFTVQHDAAHPFTVKAGDYQIRDLGTRFEVSREGERVIVSVAEGQVEVGGHGITPLTGLPGDRITISHGTATRSHVDPTIVASWRDGRLIYADAPLAMVIADINRYAAKPVALSPALADRHFSGVLTIGDGSQLARNLAEVLAVPITDTPDGQRLGAGGAD